MLKIRVLGSGCAKCEKTALLIEEVAEQLGVAIRLEKQSDPELLLRFGVMRTPAVVINDELVHSGSIPTHGSVESWLQGAGQ